MNKNNLISVAKILGFHGLNGEIRAGYTQGRETGLKAIKSMFLDYNGEFVELTVSSVRFHKKYALIKFKEVNSVNDVEKYKNLLLYVPAQKVTEQLEENEFLVSDLIGMEVYDQNDELIGVVKDVPDNSATNLLAIERNGKTYLVPFVKDLVPVIDMKNRKILINNIEGLLE